MSCIEKHTIELAKYLKPTIPVPSRERKLIVVVFHFPALTCAAKLPSPINHHQTLRALSPFTLLACVITSSNYPLDRLGSEIGESFVSSYFVIDLNILAPTVDRYRGSTVTNKFSALRAFEAQTPPHLASCASSRTLPATLYLGIPFSIL